MFLMACDVPCKNLTGIYSFEPHDTLRHRQWLITLFLITIVILWRQH